MTETQVISTFVAPTGAVFVFLKNFPIDGEVLYSPDGQKFYEIGVRSLGGHFGDKVDANYEFANPHNGVSGTFHRLDNTIECEGVEFKKQDYVVESSSIVPLPFARHAEYLCRFADGVLLYVSRDVYNWNYEGTKLFIGDGQTMHQHQNLKTYRLRENGATYVETPEGIFCAPQRLIPVSTPEPPAWITKEHVTELTFLDPDDFNIVETPEGVVTIVRW